MYFFFLRVQINSRSLSSHYFRNPYPLNPTLNTVHRGDSERALPYLNFKEDNMNCFRGLETFNSVKISSVN